MNFSFKKNKKGFTLIESLVAVTMLSIVISAIMSLAQSSIASNTYAQAQVTANYLAGEAIEYIRNTRDTEYLLAPSDSSHWLDAINSSCFSANGCDVDTVNKSFVICAPEGCPPLRFDSTLEEGFYQHASGSGSVFTRTVKIEQVATDEIAVRVIISGASGYFKNTPLVVVEHLFNWNNLAPVEDTPEPPPESSSSF